MRAIWSGSINFGLVSIPVKLYTAVQPNHLHLNLLRKEDLCPIGYKKVCRRTGEEVAKEDIVKGYQYHKGDYVVLDEKDFEKADVEKTYSITIEDFVEEKDVDIKYAEKPYYLEPDKKAQQVYGLFGEALQKSGKVGIGKFVLKEKEHLIMLRFHEDVLMLNVLRFHSEIKDPQELDLPKKVKIPRNQLELALELIDKLSGPFKPEKYQDTYNDRLKEVVEAKRKGKAPVTKGTKPRRAPAPDIVARLKESLAMAGK